MRPMLSDQSISRAGEETTHKPPLFLLTLLLILYTVPHPLHISISKQSSGRAFQLIQVLLICITQCLTNASPTARQQVFFFVKR